MEARGVGEQPKARTVVCQRCGARSEVEIPRGVPVAECPACGAKLVLRSPNFPQVVTR